ncbi:winged helix-turn-helix transcriptional regulator [Geoglobus sp.]
MDELIRKYGVQTLKAIMKRKNRARYREILEDFPATSGTLSRVLRVLEENGYISREIDPNSRPPTAYYSVTENGKILVENDFKESYMALVEFDLQEAKALLNDLKKSLRGLEK